MEGIDSKVMAFLDGKDARLLAATVAGFILQAKVASSTCLTQVSLEDAASYTNHRGMPSLSLQPTKRTRARTCGGGCSKPAFSQMFSSGWRIAFHSLSFSTVLNVQIRNGFYYAISLLTSMEGTRS